MFFYPEPEPTEHCIINVSPSYLTDGVFFTGREVGPTHKHVAKQLSVIVKGDNDQVPPRLAEVNDRTLDRWVEKSKAWHVDNCGRNAKALHAVMRFFPKEKIDPYFGWKSKVALFPRSEQYEYRYNSVRESLINDDDDDDDGDNNNLQTEDEIQVDIEKRKFLDDVVLETDPRRGITETKDRFNCAIGDPDDYGYYWYKEKLTETESPDVLNVDERSLKDVKTKKSLKNIIVNGVNKKNYNSVNENNVKGKEKIYREFVEAGIHGQGEDESSAYDKVTSSKKDAYEVDVRKISEYESKDEAEFKSQNKEKKLNNLTKLDPRWIHCRDFCKIVPSNDYDYEKRKRGMSNVLRPYKHEIGIWYSVNKPTRIQPTARFQQEGKRSKPEWHFSNL